MWFYMVEDQVFIPAGVFHYLLSPIVYKYPRQAVQPEIEGYPNPVYKAFDDASTARAVFINAKAYEIIRGPNVEIRSPPRTDNAPQTAFLADMWATLFDPSVALGSYYVVFCGISPGIYASE
jgi:hypothetical protein